MCDVCNCSNVFSNTTGLGVLWFIYNTPLCVNVVEEKFNLLVCIENVGVSFEPRTKWDVLFKDIDPCNIRSNLM